MFGVHSKMSPLLLGALLTFSSVVADDDSRKPTADPKAFCDDSMDCNAKLSIVNLCARKIRAACIDGTTINTDSLCAALATMLELKANNACINNLTTGRLCTDTIVTSSFEQCGLYRATIVYDAPTTYTLSDPLRFNTILDDPNGNVSLVPYTYYTVPVSGYYIITLQVNPINFVIPGDPILGTPIANPQVIVNGLPFREAYAAFLGFHNEQHSTMSALASLKVGDKVSARLRVLSINDSGFYEVAGTASINGDGMEGSQSLLKIHYLSSDCSPVPPACTPCTVNAPCTTCPATSCCG